MSSCKSVKRTDMKIEKLIPRYVGPDYSYSGASLDDVVSKLNEVIDALEEEQKKYNEALERARKIHDEIVNNEVIGFPGQITDIFPELRESEEERIRKEIKDIVLSYRSNCVYEGNHHFDECLAWLEKQKENPKNADSIPSDCASSAKCEDRWHKVGDSLPDNPREVLCKDEARNYFIGRYYVGEGWEISNYDDEDKPHHFNPPVSKWIDFPTEKQKEQKPAEYVNVKLNDGYPVVSSDKIVEDSAYCGPGVTVNGEPINTEPKQVDISAEWSEEDEEIFNEIIEKAKGGKWIEFDEIIWLVNRFKSLRPQKKEDLPPGFYFITPDWKKYYSKEFRYGDMKMRLVENEKKED